MNGTQIIRVILIIIIIFGFGITYRNADMAWNMHTVSCRTNIDVCDMDMDGTHCYTPDEMWVLALWQFAGTFFAVCVYLVCFGNESD